MGGAAAAAAAALAVPALAADGGDGQPTEVYTGPPIDADAVVGTQPPPGSGGESVTEFVLGTQPPNPHPQSAPPSQFDARVAPAIDSALDEGVEGLPPSPDVGDPSVNGQDEPPDQGT